MPKNDLVQNAYNATNINLGIILKQYAYLQTMTKTPVKFQNDWHKTVGGVVDTRYPQPIDFEESESEK